MSHKRLLKKLKKKLDREKKENPKKYKQDEMKLARLAR